MSSGRLDLTQASTCTVSRPTVTSRFLLEAVAGAMLCCSGAVGSCALLGEKVACTSAWPEATELKNGASRLKPEQAGASANVCAVCVSSPERPKLVWISKIFKDNQRQFVKLN